MTEALVSVATTESVPTIGRQRALRPGPHDDKNVALKVLMVEDNIYDHELILRELRRDGFEVQDELVQTPEEFTAHLRRDCPDIVLADYNLGQWRGMETVELVRQEGLDVPVILVSGALGDVTAVECIKQGATDYVLKDTLARLPSAIRRAMEERRLREDRKQAQSELDAKVEELARSNQDLEQFAYVASHDLQEPLRMVAAYVQLLEEQYAGKLDEKAHKYIHYAVDGATRMQTLIQDLLSFSRSGRPEMVKDAIDCNAVVERALGSLQAAIAGSGAQVTHDLLPTVRANRTQLEQVFQNLIGNAIKFRGSDTPQIKIQATRRPDAWEFSVRDNGIGISPEHSETIFAVFKRLHTRSEYPGNGIGLSICKKIIERHGGRIWVEPHTGPGTFFCFTLPAAELESGRSTE